MIESKPLLGRCVPSIDDSTDLPFLPSFDKLKQGVVNLAKFMDLRGFSERILNDLAKSWWIILISLLIASVVAFLWIFLMKFFAGIMVWISIVLSIALLIISCVYCGYKYVEIYNASGEGVDESFNDLIHIGFTKDFSAYTDLSATWMVFLVGSGLMLLILLIILIFLRKKIKIAIELIEEGSHAVRGMTSTLFFPIIPLLLQILVVGWFMLVGVYLASSGEAQYRLELNDCPDSKCTIGGKTVRNLVRECNPDNETSLTCDDCAAAHCMFYKYGPTSTANWFQVS